MLVLTRTVEEDIRIGIDIRVKVLAVQGSQVRLGIEAPKEVAIHRGELVEAISRQNEAARRAADAPGQSLRKLAEQVQGRIYRPPQEAGSSHGRTSPITPHRQRDLTADEDRGPAAQGAPRKRQQGSCRNPPPDAA